MSAADQLAQIEQAMRETLTRERENNAAAVEEIRRRLAGGR